LQKELICKDLKKWEETAPQYEFKRNILIKTHGGLGDEICAEPVIRYIINKAYPNAKIKIATWFPRLFKHLPVEICHINDFKPELDTPYYVMETLVPPDHPSWKYMSANLMSATDFISQTCLRAILPDEDKQIQQQVEASDINEVIDIVGEDLSNIVLIHPGKGWPSKTFPKEYWNEIIKTVQTVGCKTIIIGKDLNDDQGTVDIDVPNGVLDTRNLLSLGGLIALISKAKILISNDSSPIHIAGAFETGIVLIPTCKHPDHVLPIRKGKRDYKAISIYKKLFCEDIDSTPTQIHGQTIDQVAGSILDYLPEPKDILQAIKKIESYEHKTTQ
jgi:ADP-heptose:LPS heptosyltransferase